MNYFVKKRMKSIIFKLKDKLINLFESLILTFPNLIIVFSLIFVPLNVKDVNAIPISDDKLIDRISKDYTNKFCNSIAFGLSRESSMKFSNKENNLIFKKKKNFHSLNKDLIANKIAISVVEDCGYLVNLKGHQSITEFENDYLSMNN